jgi:hypothetical protein
MIRRSESLVLTQKKQPLDKILILDIKFNYFVKNADSSNNHLNIGRA